MYDHYYRHLYLSLASYLTVIIVFISQYIIYIYLLYFSQLLPRIGNIYVEKMGQYLVIIDTAKHLREDQEMQKMFNRAFKRNIVDIVVGVFVGNSTFIFYTYDIFFPQRCRQVIPRKFNIFKSGQLESEELFPYKLGDFQKCPIDIVVRNVDPFFVYNLTDDLKLITQYWGMEANMIRTVAEKLNFELRIRSWDEVTIPNVVYENGSASGVFQALRRKQFDIGIGYYLQSTRSRYFGASTPYFTTPIVVVVAKLKHDLILGRWLLAPFRKDVWLAILLSVAYGIFMIFCIRCVLHTRNVSWLDFWGLALGNSRNFRFRFRSSRYFVAASSIGFLLLTGAFQGKLFGAFNRQASTRPVTVSQLIAENYTFLIHQFVTPDLIKALRIPSWQLENYPYTSDEEAYKEILNSDRSLAMLANYWQYQRFVESRKLYNIYDVVPHIVVISQICAYMQPQSYLMEPMNRVLEALISGGILKKWMLDAVGIKDVETVQRYRLNPEPRTLTLGKFRTAFLILVVMYLLSVIVLLGEIIVHKISKK